ncbi:MAG: acetone carboxylase subunit alpha, partial [Candidatus Freyarchaeota archaeon]
LTTDFAEKMYGVKCRFDEKNQKWVYDAEATKKRREDIKKERLAKAVPAKEWYFREREKILKKELPDDTKRGLRECMTISPKWAKEYREFWQLPEEFTF